MDCEPHERADTAAANQRPSRLGIRTKLLVPLLVLLAFLFLVQVVVILHSSARQRETRLVERADSLARSVAAMMETERGGEFIQPILAKLAEETGADLIVVAAGEPLTIVASTRPDWVDKRLDALAGMNGVSAELHRALAWRQPCVMQQKSSDDGQTPRDGITYAMPFSAPLPQGGRDQVASGAVLARVSSQSIQGPGMAGILFGLAASTALASIIGFLLLRHMLFRRLYEMLSVVRRVADGYQELRMADQQADELGELAAAWNAMVDEISIRKQAEHVTSDFALQEIHEKAATLKELASYKAALDQHACVAVTDASGTITHVNDKFCKVTQFSREELVGKPHRFLNSDYHAKGFWVRLRQRLMEGKIWKGEIRTCGKDGTIHWMYTTIVPFRDEYGRIAKFIEIRPEVTTRRQEHDQLRETKEQFDLAVRGSNSGIWVWKLATDEIKYSSRFKQLLGYTDEDFPSQASAMRRRIHPEDAKPAINALRNHFQSGGIYDVNLRLKTKSGRWRWYRVRGEAVRDETGRARRMAGSLSDINSLKCAQENLKRAAFYDKLTGMPNRTLLLDRTRQMLVRARRTREHNYAVMFLDFDRFKFVNDSYGHSVGDALLKEIATRITGQLRAEDSVSRVKSKFTAARQGGDEFVVLLDGLDSEEDAAAVAQRVLRALACPYQLGTHEIHSTASIGIVLGSPEYACADDLLRDADTAMYEAKRTGRGRYVVFDTHMRRELQRRVRLEQDLRKALARDELFLVYQPIVSLHTGAITAIEGLIRWNHPTAGLIGPDEFIPVAEDSDLIFRLGEWVLRTGCRDMKRWEEELGSNAPPIVSLNLSRKQFNDPDLINATRKILAKSRVAPETIQLEITEDAFTIDAATAVSMMHALKDLGVRLAIDDFGVGHSSYASLQKFPVDVLKIDRSLANDVIDCQDTAALIHSVAVLVKNLGIHLVIEGIENERQLIAVSELGCDFAQGFYFGTPMVFEEVGEFLSHQGNNADSCVAGAMSFSRRWKERLPVFEERLGD